MRAEFRAMEENEAEWPDYAEQVRRNELRSLFLEDSVFNEMERRAEAEELRLKFGPKIEPSFRFSSWTDVVQNKPLVIGTPGFTGQP